MVSNPLQQAAFKLSQIFKPECLLNLPACGKRAALDALLGALVADDAVLDPQALRRAILAREAQASTGIGQGIAIPHAKLPQVDGYLMAIGRSAAGIEFEAIDGRPVHLVFMLVASDRHTREFVRLLAMVSNLLKEDGTRRELVAAPGPKEVLAILRAHES